MPSRKAKGNTVSSKRRTPVPKGKKTNRSRHKGVRKKYESPKAPGRM